MEKTDSRIKIIHQDNCGVSATRNVGLKNSTGDYIMFVDGDDWVDEQYVSYFLSLIQSTNCMIGMNENNYYVNENVNYIDKSFVISSEKAIEWIYSDKIFVAVWNKIYNRNLLENLKFNESIWYGEGMLFNIQALQLVDKVVVGNKPVYHQTFNINSAMRNFNLQSNYCGICSLWLQRSLWKKKNDNIEKQWKYHYYRFNSTIIEGLYRTGQKTSEKKAYKECIRNIRKNIFIPLLYEKSLKKRMGWICYFLFPEFMAKRRSKKFLYNEKISNENFDKVFRLSNGTRSHNKKTK